MRAARRKEEGLRCGLLLTAKASSTGDDDGDSRVMKMATELEFRATSSGDRGADHHQENCLRGTEVCSRLSQSEASAQTSPARCTEQAL